MRRHGVALTYTPMLNASVFLQSAPFAQRHTERVDRRDRPLLVQFAGHRPSVVAEAARRVQHVADGIDINFGCPQRIALRGFYGAHLARRDKPRALRVVRAVRRAVRADLPVTVKIRLEPPGTLSEPVADARHVSESGDISFPVGVEETIAWCNDLVEAGASLICIHGRTLENKGAACKPAEWGAVARVQAALDVPVIVNGSVQTLVDAEACLAASKCPGVMVANGLLSNPLLFSGCDAIDAVAAAREYMICARAYDANDSEIRRHVFSMLLHKYVSRPVAW